MADITHITHHNTVRLPYPRPIRYLVVTYDINRGAPLGATMPPQAPPPRYPRHHTRQALDTRGAAWRFLNSTIFLSSISGMSATGSSPLPLPPSCGLLCFRARPRIERGAGEPRRRVAPPCGRGRVAVLQIPRGNFLGPGHHRVLSAKLSRVGALHRLRPLRGQRLADRKLSRVELAYVDEKRRRRRSRSPPPGW